MADEASQGPVVAVFCSLLGRVGKSEFALQLAHSLRTSARRARRPLLFVDADLSTGAATRVGLLKLCHEAAKPNGQAAGAADIALERLQENEDQEWPLSKFELATLDHCAANFDGAPDRFPAHHVTVAAVCRGEWSARWKSVGAGELKQFWVAPARHCLPAYEAAFVRQVWRAWKRERWVSLTAAQCEEEARRRSLEDVARMQAGLVARADAQRAFWGWVVDSAAALGAIVLVDTPVMGPTGVLDEEGWRGMLRFVADRALPDGAERRPGICRVIVSAGSNRPPPYDALLSAHLDEKTARTVRVTAFAGEDASSGREAVPRWPQPLLKDLYKERLVKDAPPTTGREATGASDSDLVNETTKAPGQFLDTFWSGIEQAANPRNGTLGR